MSFSTTQINPLSLNDCLRLNYDELDADYDVSDDGGSPCKSARQFGSRQSSRASLFGSNTRLEIPPPLPLFGSGSSTTPSPSPTASVYSIDSPTDSPNSAVLLMSEMSEMSELESDFSDEFHFEASPVRPPARKFSYHRQNQSVLGIDFLARRRSTRSVTFETHPNVHTNAHTNAHTNKHPNSHSSARIEAQAESTPKTHAVPPPDRTMASLNSPSSLFRREYLEEEQLSGGGGDAVSGKARLSSELESRWVPAAKVRRTQSMFATPEQMLHEQVGEIYHPPSCDTSVSECMSYLGRPECVIPTFNVRQDPFPRMTHGTLLNVIDGHFGPIYEEVVVIDCRFEYEYEGGHIDGAINVNTKQQLEQVLFPPHKTAAHAAHRRQLLVFHCEYSAYRSPMMASHLRKCDRELNAARYPHLFYPDVVVLEGGYSQFYASAAHRCVPQNYVGMNTLEHESTCKREMQRFRHGMKQTSRKRELLNMSAANRSSPQLAEFKFPAPALAFRSASVANLEDDLFKG